LFDQRRIADMARRSHCERVAVGRRFRHDVGPDYAATAASIIDEHRPAECFRELLRNHARLYIDATARHGRRDDAYRLAREILRVRWRHDSNACDSQCHTCNLRCSTHTISSGETAAKLYTTH